MALVGCLNQQTLRSPLLVAFSVLFVVFVMPLFTRILSRAQRRRRRLERQAAAELEAAEAAAAAEAVEVVDSLHHLLSENVETTTSTTTILSPSALARREYIRNVLVVKTINQTVREINGQAEGDDIGKGDLVSCCSQPTDGLDEAKTNAHDHTSCAICLLDYEVNDQICWSQNPNCSHAFHLDCISGWLMQPRDDCPCCRQNYMSFGEEEDDTEREPQAVTEMLEDSNTGGGDEPVDQSQSERENEGRLFPQSEGLRGFDEVWEEEEEDIFRESGIRALVNALLSAHLQASLPYYQSRSSSLSETDDDSDEQRRLLANVSSHSATVSTEDSSRNENDRGLFGIRRDDEQNNEEAASDNGGDNSSSADDIGYADLCQIGSDESIPHVNLAYDGCGVGGEGFDLSEEPWQTCLQQRPKRNESSPDGGPSASDYDDDENVNLGLGDLIVDGLMSRLEQQNQQQQPTGDGDANDSDTVSSSSMYTNGEEQKTKRQDRASCAACGNCTGELHWSADPLCSHLFHRICLGHGCPACLREPMPMEDDFGNDVVEDEEEDEHILADVEDEMDDYEHEHIDVSHPVEATVM